MNHMKFIHLIRLAMPAFLVVAFASATLAQAPDQPTAVDPETVTEEQIDATAKAYVDVVDISQEYEQSLAEIQSPEEAQQLQLESEQRMVSVIEEQGLTPEEYNGIILAANEDEDLHNRLVAAIAQHQGEDPMQQQPQPEDEPQPDVQPEQDGQPQQDGQY